MPQPASFIKDINQLSEDEKKALKTEMLAYAYNEIEALRKPAAALQKFHNDIEGRPFASLSPEHWPKEYRDALNDLERDYDKKNNALNAKLVGLLEKKGYFLNEMHIHETNAIIEGKRIGPLADMPDDQFKELQTQTSHFTDRERAGISETSRRIRAYNAQGLKPSQKGELTEPEMNRTRMDKKHLNGNRAFFESFRDSIVFDARSLSEDMRNMHDVVPPVQRIPQEILKSIQSTR